MDKSKTFCLAMLISLFFDDAAIISHLIIFRKHFPIHCHLPIQPLALHPTRPYHAVNKGAIFGRACNTTMRLCAAHATLVEAGTALTGMHCGGWSCCARWVMCKIENDALKMSSIYQNCTHQVRIFSDFLLY